MRHAGLKEAVQINSTNGEEDSVLDRVDGVVVGGRWVMNGMLFCN